MRIFLDANILFSAAKTDGAIRRLLALLLDAGHECWVDLYVLAEARRNLAAKTSEGSAALELLLPRLHQGGMRAANEAIEASLPLPEKDRPVLAAAIHLRCHALVTGDKAHFGALYGRAVHGVVIHSPRSIAETLI